MKIIRLSFLITSLAFHFSFAQNIILKNWVRHNIDSLHKIGVDTVVYYRSYCGECTIIEPKNETANNKQHCNTDNGWAQISNTIIYRQKGKYFSIEFNCNYPVIKKSLNDGQSILYFISVIPILNKRDKVEKERVKRGIFNPPVIADGGHEEVDLYLGKIKQHAYMQEDQKTEKAWQVFFWIKTQTELLKKIKADLSAANILKNT